MENDMRALACLAEFLPLDYEADLTGNYQGRQDFDIIWLSSLQCINIVIVHICV